VSDLTIGHSAGRRRIAMGAAVASAALLLAACGSSSGSSTSSSPASSATGTTAATPLNAIFGPGGAAGGQNVTVQDGMVLALSGPGLVYGDAMQKAANLAAEQIKAAGGPTFVINTGDHNNGDPAKGLVTIQKAVALSPRNEIYQFDLAQMYLNNRQPDPVLQLPAFRLVQVERVAHDRLRGLYRQRRVARHPPRQRQPALVGLARLAQLVHQADFVAALG